MDVSDKRYSAWSPDKKIRSAHEAAVWNRWTELAKFVGDSEKLEERRRSKDE